MSKTPATILLSVVAGVALFGAAPAAGQEVPSPAPGGEAPAASGATAPADLSVRIKGLKGGRRPALRRTMVVGTVRPFVPGQRVRVRLLRRGTVVKRKRVAVRRVAGTKRGSFRLRSPRLSKPGRYVVRAVKPRTSEQRAANARSKRFRLRFSGLGQGDRGRAVAVLNRMLRRQGYHAPKGKRFGAGTAAAVLAFRKVNRMAWNRRATPSVLTRLARGRGAFALRHPGAGRHVEIDLTRQVMVLAAKGKPQHTFHVSTGKPGTPSDRGHFRFFRRQPGYNSVGMLHSVYYNRGEAIHGYKSVPTYPASNGCIRNPIPNSKFIYDWVRLGMSIYVY